MMLVANLISAWLFVQRIEHWTGAGAVTGDEVLRMNFPTHFCIQGAIAQTELLVAGFRKPIIECAQAALRLVLSQYVVAYIARIKSIIVSTA